MKNITYSLNKLRNEIEETKKEIKETGDLLAESEKFHFPPEAILMGLSLGVPYISLLIALSYIVSL